jgi:aspartate ammonia-lyase
MSLFNSAMNNAFRIERDCLGELPVPAEALHGIHTARALGNFPLARRSVHPELVRAYGDVKSICARTNRALGAWADDVPKADAIDRACRELANGDLGGFIIVDAMQGGAGTSTNMNVNEVLANRALEILGLPPGSYDRISPLDDLNLHQSTNDTYPTALRLAAIRLLHTLEQKVVALQESFQAVEKKFAHIVKVGRTQFQDAVLTTLGREMSAYAEAINRDRWRIYKCEEWLRVVNLGGTAIGTGLAAPRQYIFQVVDQLREITGIGFARAENLVDATQNADVFVEVSGI